MKFIKLTEVINDERVNIWVNPNQISYMRFFPTETYIEMVNRNYFYVKETKEEIEKLLFENE